MMKSAPSASTLNPSSGCSSRTAMRGTPDIASALTGTNAASRRSAQRSSPQPCIARCTSWMRSFAGPSVRVRVVARTSMSLVRGLKAPVDRDPWTYTPARFLPSALRQEETARDRKEPSPGPPARMIRGSISIADTVSPIAMTPVHRNRIRSGRLLTGSVRTALEASPPAALAKTEPVPCRQRLGIVCVHVQTGDLDPERSHSRHRLGDQRAREPEAAVSGRDPDLVDPTLAADHETRGYARPERAERRVGKEGIVAGEPLDPLGP